jgi:hypothetical protein
VFGIYSLFKCDTIDENHEEYCECAKAHFDNAQKTSEQKTGMEKIKGLKNRLGNLAMTDDRPAVWRICRSLVESLDEIENEHFAEMEDLSHANTVLKAELDKANSVINEQMSKIQEADEEIEKLKEQLKAMSDLANSAMADAQKWQNAYLNLRVETPLLPPPLPGRVWYLDGKPVDESLIMSRQVEMAQKAQEERIPRKGQHLYRVSYYSYDDRKWNDVELWSDCMKGIEDWVVAHCGGAKPLYDAKVLMW